MNTIFPPSKLRRLSHSSSGSGSGGLSMERNGAPPIGLGLTLGTGGGSREDKKHDQQEVQMQMQRRSRSYGFTMHQMQELKHQTIIYKYIEARCVVPYSLVLPIWKSVSSSFGNINIIPNFIRGNRQLKMEYGKGMDMDPEPGRCRRTDGKKWRCSKEAVQDQKYCEKHVNRGRQRTKKLMEVTAEMDNDHASTKLSIALPSPNNN
ncbi:growth-regulating factor 2 [Euphorbia peplus]|nr:growth-regulating factor 2 [Euphorbia peplus]